MEILWIEDDYDEYKAETWLGINHNYSVTVKKDFTEAYDEIQTKINSYDLVILDMDLNKSDPDTSMVQEFCKKYNLTHHEFFIEGGYHLYTHLLKLCFPTERILCFTGNFNPHGDIKSLHQQYKNSPKEEKLPIYEELNKLSANELSKKIAKQQKQDPNLDLLKIIENVIDKYIYETTKTDGDETLLKRFDEARISPPEIISKSDPTQLRISLNKVNQDQYILLRRGIITASEYFLENINESPKLHLELRTKAFFKHDSKYFENEDAILLIHTICNLLPIQKPNENQEKYIIDELLRLLSHHFGNVDRQLIKKIDEKIVNSFKTKNTDDDTYNNLALFTFVEIMKTVRNWSAHEKIFMCSDYSLCAYIFLIHMRTIFMMPEKTQRYEKQLLKIIGKPCEEEQWGNMDEHGLLKKTLSNNYDKIYKRFSGKFNNYYVNDLINNALISHKKGIKDKEYLQGLYYYFWFLTSKSTLSPYRPPNGDSNHFKIEYELYPYSKIEYLSDFAKYLYPKTFE